MLHLGTPHLGSILTPLNLAGIALVALALWRAVMGPAPERPIRKRVFLPATVLASIGWLATPTAVLFAPSLSHPAAFAYIGFVTAWAWMLRDRETDDDDQNRGGDQPLRPQPPDGPSDGGIDWDRFESDFWSHVRDRDLTPV
jgi:hypothetical protein